MNTTRIASALVPALLATALHAEILGKIDGTNLSGSVRMVHCDAATC